MNDSSSVAAFAGSVNLASERIGAAALLCSDDFFAGMENLTKVTPAVFIPEKYTERGKWMDGWESRRRRTPGHDWCILKLGVPGQLVGVDIDTHHFLGNHPPFGSLDACVADPDATGEQLRDSAEWVRVLEQVPLQRGSHNLHALSTAGAFTHVRLNMYPAGGVARLRVYGRPKPAPRTVNERFDLASVTVGGRALACSDMFFSDMNNLLLPQRATNMGQGWETRRSRPPGKDWVIVELGVPGLVEEVLLDTCHFKGNYPDTAALDGLFWPGAPAHALVRSEDWTEILADTPMGPHQEHRCSIHQAGPWTHLRLRIVPDGGVSRLRALGRPLSRMPADDDPMLSWLNDAPEGWAGTALSRCCGSTRWVQSMLAARPFTSRTHLYGQAEQIWWHLDQTDWHEAFSHHPRIGADVEKLREKFAATADMSSKEQAGVRQASERTLKALAQGNADYEQRYGHIFIVCASGLRARDMLARLRRRMNNEAAAELRIAAGQQAQITRLRLDAMQPEQEPTP